MMDGQSGSESSEYFSKWWESNGRRVRADRRREYEADPAKREAIKKSVKRRYERSRGGLNYPHPTVYLSSYDARPYYTPSIARRLLGLSWSLWYRFISAFLPEADIKVDARGWRLFTAAQIKLMVVAYDKYKAGSSKLEVQQFVIDGWLEEEDPVEFFEEQKTALKYTTYYMDKQ